MGKYDAVLVVSAADAKKIPDHAQIPSRAFCMNKSTNMTKDLLPKCCIVGRRFQEYDEKLRRDSPKCTPLMAHSMGSIAASEKTMLYAADARGALLEGKTVERELCLHSRATWGHVICRADFPLLPCVSISPSAAHTTPTPPELGTLRCRESSSAWVGRRSPSRSPLSSGAVPMDMFWVSLRSMSLIC